MYPVSYVLTYVPQDAAQGIGVSLIVGCFTESEFDVTGSPDRQSVIITVKTKRTLETGGPAAAAPIEAQKTEVACRYENGLISIQALKVNMLKVLGGMAKESGLNIVVDDAVGKRTVSMSLQDVRPEDAIQYIASAYGLALSKKGDVYMVSEGVPTDLATYRASGTQSFPMKFVRAQTASELLPTFLYSYVHVNSEQNAVVVSAPNQMLEKIGTDLAKVDIAPPQIMIEAIAVELSSLEESSVWLGLTGQGHAGQGALSTETGDISYTTVGKLPSDFEARLKALVAQHKAKIYSTPRMAVVNGQTAEIFVGAQRFIHVEYFLYGTKCEKIQGVDVGTHIAVTPWTGGNGEITTTIAPEVSNIVELDRTTGLPTLSSRSASTTVRVKDGETIVIGGLTQQQDYSTSRKIPILGDLPIVGPIFRSKSTSSTSTELVILITPRLLTESGHLPNAEEESRIKKRMLMSQRPE
jgi:type IV pilus assembly protein PilQ